MIIYCRQRGRLYGKNDEGQYYSIRQTHLSIKPVLWQERECKQRDNGYATAMKLPWASFWGVESLLSIWSYLKLSLNLCYLFEPLLHLLWYPVVEKCVLLIIFLHLFGPNCLVPVLQLLEHLVEEVLAHFLRHKHHQSFRKQWNMMIYQCINRVRKTFGTQTSQLHCQVFDV